MSRELTSSDFCIITAADVDLINMAVSLPPGDEADYSEFYFDDECYGCSNDDCECKS